MQIPQTWIYSFSDHILVRCPRCAGCAHLRETNDRDGYRLVCPACALFRDWSLKQDGWSPSPNSGPMLGRLGLEVWLQRPCCGQTLWVFNEDHLHYLEQVVAPKLRQRQRHESVGWFNRSLDSRLPRWMLEGRHREAVLASLQALRGMLPQPSGSA